ncbi:hypothetical protein NSTC745_02742 [Nostoc sp. DSM 114161]|jgi:hypothetical protein|uniref:hypothetical protein n=1 Tax=Nostoc sp. DSM 114161 TaxID=3440143 RepID=UPI0040466DCE
MNNNPNQPREFDAVLGGELPPPVIGVVLGGLESVKSRLQSPIAEIRCMSITQAANYGKEGLDLIIAALNDASGQVRNCAYNLLLEKAQDVFLQESDLKIRQALFHKVRLALFHFDKFKMFTTLKDWVIHDYQYNDWYGITENIGYKLKNINELDFLIQKSQNVDFRH